MRAERPLEMRDGLAARSGDRRWHVVPRDAPDCGVVGGLNEVEKAGVVRRCDLPAFTSRSASLGDRKSGPDLPERRHRALCGGGRQFVRLPGPARVLGHRRRPGVHPPVCASLEEEMDPRGCYTKRPQPATRIKSQPDHSPDKSNTYPPTIERAESCRVRQKYENRRWSDPQGNPRALCTPRGHPVLPSRTGAPLIPLHPHRA